MLRRAVESLKIGVDGEKHDENQYLSLINDILLHGEETIGRNGTTKAVFGAGMVFNLEDGTLPLLTTKKVAWKTCLKELLWFIQGSTDNDVLRKQKVKIWDGNASREFLDSRGLNHLEEGDLGPVYGYQWRHFNAEYKTRHDDYSGQGFDQLQYVIDQLKDPEQRSSRRIIMSAWNPCQLNEMALPPCHVLCQFNVIGNKLSCSLYQRSGDVGLGVPFNIASYSFLTHLLAKHCDLEPHEFVYYLGNAHIYDDHYDALKDQIIKKPYLFPKLNISNKKSNINNYILEDFVVSDYNHHEVIKMEMRK
ncbi:MAG: thymidylate synthase [Candidatus Pelagibacter sp.]|nr:thymidylate synthase [Candidatus Pelagibacter sp.]|tara:strand:+ start:2434 stop:3351 length:918 start_codon:yes stop_codon:yes gene_type:complete